MIRKYGYSGINSATFVKAFDPQTRIFDKSRVPEMDNPGKLFVYLSYLDYSFNGSRVLHGPSCANLSSNRAKNYGGIPMVIRVSLEELLGEENYHIEHQWRSGKKSPRRLTIEPPVMRVDKIYRVQGYVAGAINLLKEIETDALF